jgi:hypothetical protein
VSLSGMFKGESWKENYLQVSKLARTINNRVRKQ